MAPKPAWKTYRNKKNSPLLKLPDKIKDKIYTYALAADHPIELNKNSVDGYRRLLKVCTQTYQEATPIFYANNNFRITNIRSEAMNFVRLGGVHIQKLSISFEVPRRLRKAWVIAGGKNNTATIWDKMKKSADELLWYLLAWGVAAKAIEVEKPNQNAFPKAVEFKLVNCLGSMFEARLRAVAGPKRTGAMGLAEGGAPGAE